MWQFHFVVVQGGTELFFSACRTCSTLIFYNSTNQILNLWRCFLITTGEIELEAHDVPLASSKNHALFVPKLQSWTTQISDLLELLYLRF